MLSQMICHYFPGGGTNCAESMLLAYREAYQKNLPPECVKMMAGFGGGCGSGKICGALVGCIAALGLQEVETCAHESETIRPKTVEMVKGFEEAFGSVNCEVIKANYQQSPQRCRPVLEKAAEILEELLER